MPPKLLKLISKPTAALLIDLYMVNVGNNAKYINLEYIEVGMVCTEKIHYKCFVLCLVLFV